MRYLVIALAIVGFGCGITGAIHWWRASAAIPVHTKAVEYNPEGTGADAASAFLNDLQRATALNKWAAIWTGVAILFATAATLVGTFSNPN